MGDDSGQGFEGVYFFCELKNLLSEFGVFFVHLFDDGGLYFDDLVFLFSLGLFGTEWEVSVGVGWAVLMMGKAVSSGVGAIIIGSAVGWVESFLEFLDLLLILLNFLKFILPLTLNPRLQPGNLLNKPFNLHLKIDNNIIFVLNQIIGLFDLDAVTIELGFKGDFFVFI